MSEEIDLKSIAWHVCAALRASIELSKSAQITVALLLVKFLSDINSDRHAPVSRQAWPKPWKDVKIPPECDWNKLAILSNPADYLERTFRSIEQTNPILMGGTLISIYHDTIRDSSAQSAIRNAVEIISRVDLRPSRSSAQEIGRSFDALLQSFSEILGKNTGAFYVPPELSALLAGILAPLPGEVILDPVCGAGLLLTKLAAPKNTKAVGQDWRASELSLCKVNLFMHGLDNSHLHLSNALLFPLRNADGKILQADVVVSNPPFGIRNQDLYGRFDVLGHGVSPRGLADYAFIAHMLEAARDSTGRVAVITSLGTLSRGDGSRFRRHIIEENLLEGVVALPTNLFSTTRVPVAILFFKKHKSISDVIFVDGSDCFTTDGSKINRLTEQGITRIVGAVHKLENVPGFARRVSPAEIRKNDFQLSVSRYVSQGSERPDLMSVSALAQNVRRIETDLAAVQTEIEEALKDVGVEPG